MSNFDFTEGLFGFSDFGIGGGVMTANKPKKKETKKTGEKKTTAAKAVGYRLPVKLLFDGGLPVEITGEGIVTKKELLQKIADQTLVQDFANEENFLLINVGAEKQYLVRPTPTCEVKKGTLNGKSVYYQNHIEFISDLSEDGEEMTDVQELIKYFSKIGFDVELYCVGDTYFPVPVDNKHGSLSKLHFPILVKLFTEEGDLGDLQLTEEMYMSQEDGEVCEDSDEDSDEKTGIDRKKLLNVMHTFFPYYEGYDDIVVDEKGNAVTMIYKSNGGTPSQSTKKEEEMYPTDAVISLIITKIQLEPQFFGGKEEVTGKEIIKYLQKLYPEYAPERTELRYDKNLKLIMPLLKSGKRGAYILEDKEAYRKEFSPMMDLLVEKATGKGSFKWNLPKMPYRILYDAMHFFWDVYVLKKSEAIVLVYYDPDEGYSMEVPKQRATGSVVEFDREFNDKLLVMEFHSHAGFPAFWSYQDDADELSHRLYAVAGNLSDFQYDAAHLIVRAGTGGYHLKVNPAEVFEMPKKDSEASPLMVCFE